jgi:hypothetical protein
MRDLKKNTAVIININMTNGIKSNIDFNKNIF